MATLTVLKFDTAMVQKGTLEVIENLSKQQMIKLHDAAIVAWPRGKNNRKQSI